jgi:hypothetical protein
MKILLTLLFSFFFLTIKTSEANITNQALRKSIIRNNYERLAIAVYLQESSGNPNAIGAANDVGLYQITPCRLENFNRLTGKNYSLNDRFNPEISREIFNYYAHKIGIENLEKIARKWNRSSKWQDEKGLKYWKLVEKRYKKLMKS